MMNEEILVGCWVAYGVLSSLIAMVSISDMFLCQTHDLITPLGPLTLSLSQLNHELVRY